ncbi:MAG: YdcF family protein [Gluconacetobacter diazotrophicus]|nr:YdcF family protein [Gluconacetobacter diazotrophicus]
MPPVIPPVIVVFGAAVRPDGAPTLTLVRRVEAARSCAERLDPPPLFLLSGGVGRHLPPGAPSEASVMGRLLGEAGIPPDRLLLDEASRDTLDTVLAARALCRRLPPGTPFLAATSAYHLPRCLLLLRLAGVPVRAAPPPDAPASRSLGRRWRWRLREVPAIPWDALLLVLHRCGMFRSLPSTLP